MLGRGAAGRSPATPRRIARFPLRDDRLVWTPQARGTYAASPRSTGKSIKGRHDPRLFSQWENTVFLPARRRPVIDASRLANSARSHQIAPIQTGVVVPRQRALGPYESRLSPACGRPLLLTDSILRYTNVLPCRKKAYAYLRCRRSRMKATGVRHPAIAPI